ncbi:MAG: glycosyltransferase family 8 protein [Lachnospiraceae bacterium]|nr:glycosyltransferase family 8 protein [Lachnospiraceae bacterium]
MNRLDVLYAADDNYAPFLGVSLMSLLENNRDIEEIRIYAVLDNVSEKNRGRLEKTVESFGRDLRITDAKDFNRLMEELGVPKYRGSYATHYRKFFHLIIDEDVERLLYIDSDTIVDGSLKELLSLDMGDACVGVVLDVLGTKYKKLLGFGDDETYFNAGVTLIDVNNWKKNDCTNAMMEHIRKVRAKYCNPDQDLFNVVLRGKTMVLPPEYNYMPIHEAYSDDMYEKNYGFAHYYSREEVEKARKAPVIIHMFRFLGEFPWHKGNLHPNTELFDSYLKRSLWADYEKKPSGNQTALFKIERLLYRMLPRGLFLKIFRIQHYRSFYKREMAYRKETEGMVSK